MNKPFNNQLENKKYQDLYTNYIKKDLDEMTLSTDIDIMKYLEIVVSALLLEINKKFPEPNYSFYMTYRIKSQRSNIEKLEDYIKRVEKKDSSISIKDITDLIGLRIIIEKIPHNITINQNNDEYETLKSLYDERKQNIRLSEEYHDFETQIDNNTCTCFEYYSKSKELLQNIIESFMSETSYDSEYAMDLREKYNTLIKECEKKLTILTALGDYSTKMSFDSITEDSSPLKIDFKKLLENFDARLDSKLGLKLYSNALPEIIENSSTLKKLGVTISTDDSRIKNKREPSGYVSDFFGLDFKGIPIKSELQIMYTNEHQESIIGYSAHSKMPGKEANFMEIPPEYVRRNMALLDNLGNSEIITNTELSLLNTISTIKPVSSENVNLFMDLTSSSNVIFENNIPVGVKIDQGHLQNLKSYCTLDEEQKEKLRSNLYSTGCKIFDAWVKNISAYHATARIDKDSSTKNRVKIHYDDPYECLAHTIREQILYHNAMSIDSHYYLERIYKNQSEWLTKSGLMATESSVIDFEIDEYTKNVLPSLLEKVDTYMNYDEIEK